MPRHEPEYSPVRANIAHQPHPGDEIRMEDGTIYRVVRTHGDGSVFTSRHNARAKRSAAVYVEMSAIVWRDLTNAAAYFSTPEARMPALPPVPLRKWIDCPKCCTPHIDRGEWATKPHHKHLCDRCGHVWRVEPYTAGIDPGDACRFLGCRNGTVDGDRLCAEHVGKAGLKWPHARPDPTGESVADDAARVRLFLQTREGRDFMTKHAAHTQKVQKHLDDARRLDDHALRRSYGTEL
jgi:hypothetical protein